LLFEAKDVEQAILHLIGDYITQTDWMANEKTKRTWAAFCHATVYSLPFCLLTNSLLALLVIWLSHLLIDRFRLARYVIFAKNWITNRTLKWADCSGTGYPSATPPWLAVWLMIIADNTMHITINYVAIRWL
jgi:hypothetical protein